MGEGIVKLDFCGRLDALRFSPVKAIGEEGTDRERKYGNLELGHWQLSPPALIKLNNQPEDLDGCNAFDESASFTFTINS